MLHATSDTIERLYEAALQIDVVDPHTHIQDDLVGFDASMASQNLTGTQAGFNAFPNHIIDISLDQKRLVRRLMMDPTHGLAYSWFAEVAEGAAGRIDSIIASVGDNAEADRREAGRQLVLDMRDCRHSEYAEWIRTMFSLYAGDQADALDPAHYDAIYYAMRSKRNDPDFAEHLLRQHRVRCYVTSIENRAGIPLDPAQTVRVADIDLSEHTHPEAYSMFDANYLVWPEGATDFGLFFAGHKYEAERYIIVLEDVFGAALDTPARLEDAVREFFWAALWSPDSNPASRIRYTDLVHPIGFNLNEPYDITRVAAALRHQKGSLRGDDLRQVVAFVSRAMLETLDAIGREIRSAGTRHGSCLQICLGATYFLDASREIQSFPVYRAQMPQSAYTMWASYPNIHFEYIIADEHLYADFSNAAKQVANVSVGPWWHYVRRHKIAAMIYDQLSMGPVSSIASGITDARFVEMLVAKYRSVRRAVAMALAALVDDPWSSQYRKHDKAIETMKEILYKNPVAIHHLPISVDS